MNRDIAKDIKDAIDGLVDDGRVVIIDRLVINVASGGGARAGDISNCRACEGSDGCLICGDIYSVPDGHEDEGLCWYCERKALEAAITSLRAQLAEAKADNARLREELEWYGEQARLARLIHGEGDAGRHALSDDGGKRARQALADTPEATQ